jgi:hypothetical protein
LLLNLPVQSQEFLARLLGKTIAPVHALFPGRSKSVRDS